MPTVPLCNVLSIYAEEYLGHAAMTTFCPMVMETLIVVDFEIIFQGDEANTDFVTYCSQFFVRIARVEVLEEGIPISCCGDLILIQCKRIRDAGHHQTRSVVLTNPIPALNQILTGGVHPLRKNRVAMECWHKWVPTSS
jgi:hypothetical protein